MRALSKVALAQVAVPLYFVSVDIATCFDTLDQQRVIEVGYSRIHTHIYIITYMYTHFFFVIH